VQSSSQIITTNKPTPNILQAGYPSCHPTSNVREEKPDKGRKVYMGQTDLPLDVGLLVVMI